MMGPGGLITSHLQPHAVPQCGLPALAPMGAPPPVLGRAARLQIAQVQLLVGVLVHPLQSLESSCWCLGVVQVLVQVHHLWRSWSPPTLQEGPQFQAGVDHPVNGGLLGVLKLLLSNPPPGLLPFRLECIGEDACRLVGAHPNEHGYEAVDPLLHCLADVLVRTTEPLGLSATTLAPAARSSSSTLARASHQQRDDPPARPPGRSQCRRRRSRCRPRGLLLPSTDALIAQQSSATKRRPSIPVQGHSLTRRRLLLELRSSFCRLMPWHCTLTGLPRCGEQKDAAAIPEDPLSCNFKRLKASSDALHNTHKAASK